MEDFNDFFSRTLKPFDIPPTVAKEPYEDPVFKRLRKHKFYKAVIRCTTGSPVRRRVHIGRFTPDLETVQPTQGHVKRTFVTLESLRDEMDNLNKDPRKCIADRASFRESFDKMGDCVKWLKNKPERNNLEEKYLRKGLVQDMKEAFFGVSQDGSYKDAYNYFQRTSLPGDKFVSQETVGLHVLDEYMQKNDEDLFEFLSALDQSKNGKLEWPTLVNALHKVNIPLETFEILQGVTALECSEGEDVNYPNLCRKMENFRKYKWNRILTKNKGYCDNLVETLDSAKSWDILIEPYKFTDSGSKRLKARTKSSRQVMSMPGTLRKKQTQPPSESFPYEPNARQVSNISNGFRSPRQVMSMPGTLRKKQTQPPSESFPYEPNARQVSNIRNGFRSPRQGMSMPGTLKELLKKQTPPSSQRFSIESKPRQSFERCQKCFDFDEADRPKKRNKFWPGVHLDKLRPCYMPLDRMHPEDNQHPLFHIIRQDIPARKPGMKPTPFARYTIYGNDKKI